MRNVATTSEVTRLHSNRIALKGDVVGLDHSWARQRSENIEKMWRQTQTDDDYALAIAIDVINARSNDMRQIGDTSYANLLSAVSVRLGNIRMVMIEKPRRKRAAKR